MGNTELDPFRREPLGDLEVTYTAPHPDYGTHIQPLTCRLPLLLVDREAISRARALREDLAVERDKAEKYIAALDQLLDSPGERYKQGICELAARLHEDLAPLKRGPLEVAFYHNRPGAIVFELPDLGEVHLPLDLDSGQAQDGSEALVEVRVGNLVILHRITMTRSTTRRVAQRIVLALRNHWGREANAAAAAMAALPPSQE